MKSVLYSVIGVCGGNVATLLSPLHFVPAFLANVQFFVFPFVFVFGDFFVFKCAGISTYILGKQGDVLDSTGSGYIFVNLGKLEPNLTFLDRHYFVLTPNSFVIFRFHLKQ